MDAVIVITFMTVPASVPDGVRVGGLFVYFHEVVLLAAVVYAGVRLRQAKPVGRRMLHSPVAIALGVFIVSVMIAVAHGLVAGYPIRDVQYDMRPVVAMVGAVFVAAVIVSLGDVARHVPALFFTLSGSALLMLVSSVTGLALSGREEAAQLYTTTGRLVAGGSDAHRLLTSTTPLALAVTLIAVALLLVGVGRTKMIVVLLIPALIVDFLSFSRNAFLGVGVMLAFLIVTAVVNGMLLRIIVRIAVALGVLAVALGLAFVGASSMGAHEWAQSQVSGYSNRVISGLDESTRTVDSSTQDRRLENHYLAESVGDKEILGNGLGLRYKPATGAPEEFAAGAGQLYAHNYYGWIRTKAGVLGLVAFLGVLATCVLPVILRNWRDGPSIAVAGTTAGLAAVIAVAPMPNDHGGSIVFGCLLGYAIARAACRGDVMKQDAAVTPDDILTRAVH
ncbi:O-antigen ligase family protein [Gordonia sp. SL306]|uniref:O-antigen ligase family protein n=1 Tax=Gordonia sp. SL306 TaxID=2995145 RepID=UPI00226DD6FA|nr:O-antigen ligase family protein [Gordonia sp. SL306]WAC56755.1 O-antigen ligase family protein [Gordonia sp. SL306]